ncbi:hypothetical protein [Eubacterium sp.]
MFAQKNVDALFLEYNDKIVVLGLITTKSPKKNSGQNSYWLKNLPKKFGSIADFLKINYI